MVDWHSSAAVGAETNALIKFIHAIGGIYIWEIMLFLGFEYSVIMRKRKFTWPFLLYLGCRWCPLFSIAFQFLGFDVSHKINCQACVVLTFMSAYLSFMCASALIILRVVVLWDHSKIIIAFTCAVWIGNTAIYAYSLTTLRSAWTGSLCAILNSDFARISICSTFTTDVILLVLMLTGLKRWKHAPRSCGVWRLLRTQGLMWVLVVTLAEVPPTVFILLNLNGIGRLDPLDLMFQPLGLTIAALGAARLYRGLIDYPASNGLVMVVNKPHSELLSPFSHQTCRTAQHNEEAGSVVPDSLAVKTSGSEVARGETLEGGNRVHNVMICNVGPCPRRRGRRADALTRWLRVFAMVLNLASDSDGEHQFPGRAVAGEEGIREVELLARKGSSGGSRMTRGYATSSIAARATASFSAPGSSTHRAETCRFVRVAGKDPDPESPPHAFTATKPERDDA
ncbi:hypothetical protein EDB87DRAFT_1682117 [Lactarius vividus]|nr:hypothetical protein EDB87DRAFT_1682117 [Lactarius vividus]